MAENQNGWLYDIASGLCAGPASYEQAEQFRKTGRPIATTLSGGPIRYTIRVRTDIPTVLSEPSGSEGVGVPAAARTTELQR